MLYFLLLLFVFPEGYFTRWLGTGDKRALCATQSKKYHRKILSIMHKIYYLLLCVSSHLVNSFRMESTFESSLIKMSQSINKLIAIVINII
jgi:hypothetical protein